MPNSALEIVFVVAFLASLALSQKHAERLRDELKARFGRGRLADPEFVAQLDQAFERAHSAVNSVWMQLVLKGAAIVGIFVGLAIAEAIVPERERAIGATPRWIVMMIGLAFALGFTWLVHLLELQMTRRKFFRILDADGVAPPPPAID